MLWGRLGWKTAGAACDGDCSLSFNPLDEGASSASRGCRSSSSQLLREQREKEAARAARVRGCRSSSRRWLREQWGLQEQREMEPRVQLETEAA